MIDMLVFDVDGCLTNGLVTYTNSGEEIKSFDVKDGLGIASWNRLGKKSAIITGRNSKIVDKRAQELNITYIYQGVKNKVEVLKEILKKENLKWKNVAAIGDDMNDLGMLNKVGWSFTPQDGIDFIKLNVNTVLKNNGGNGAIREMIDLIIKKEKLHKDFTKLWL